MLEQLITIGNRVLDLQTDENGRSIHQARPRVDRRTSRDDSLMVDAGATTSRTCPAPG